MPLIKDGTEKNKELRFRQVTLIFINPENYSFFKAQAGPKTSPEPSSSQIFFNFLDPGCVAKLSIFTEIIRYSIDEIRRKSFRF